MDNLSPSTVPTVRPVLDAPTQLRRNLRDSDPFGGPYTCGEYGTEKESAAAFDALALQAGFHIQREVVGIARPHVGQLATRLRIDRIITPSDQLIEHGWRFGAVGVEIKRSMHKLGRPVAQAIDYIHATWPTPINAVFIWPIDDDGGGPLSSVMAQHRIGSCSPTYQDEYALRPNGIKFAIGPHVAATIKRGDVRSTELPVCKIGSR